MIRPSAPTLPSEESRANPRPRYLQHTGLWALGLAVPAGYLGLAGVYNPGMTVSDSAATVLGIWALFYPLYVYRSRRVSLASFASWVAFAGLALAIASIATGIGNGLTDEPYVMPYFIGPLLHGQNPYSTPIYVTYVQYGTIYQVGPVRYIYLPLLLFFQPFLGGGTGYKLFAVATWAATIYLLRKNPFAVIAVSQPYVALLAASGFNDFPALLLLTVGFVGLAGHPQKWATYLALGTKQFANVFVGIYYLIQRDWKNFGIAIGVSLAWILPFFLWSPSDYFCGAVLGAQGGCSHASAPGFFVHLNYWVWPVWVLAVYFVPLRGYYHRFTKWVRRAPAGTGSPGVGD